MLDLKRPGLLPLIGQTKIENPDELIPKVYAEIKSIPDEETQHRLLTELLALLQDKEVAEMVETLIEQDEWFLDTPFIRKWRNRIEEAENHAKEIDNQLKEAQNHVKETQNSVKEAENHAKEVENQAEKALRKAEEERRRLEEAARRQIEETARRAEEAARQTEEIARRAEETRQQEIQRARETRCQDILNLVAARYNPSLQEGLRLQQYLSTITTDEKFRAIFEAIVYVEDFEQFYMIVEEAAAGQGKMAANL